MTRRETIIELLRWLPEAVGGGAIGSDFAGGGPDSKLLTFGPLYYDSEQTWRELLRCLQLLKQRSDAGRSSGGGEYAHLMARFYGGYSARKQVRVQRRNQDFTPLGLVPHQEVQTYGSASKHSKNVLDCLVYTWPAWVRARKVNGALEFLDASFRGSPFLPVKVLAA